MTHVGVVLEQQFIQMFNLSGKCVGVFIDTFTPKGENQSPIEYYKVAIRLEQGGLPITCKATKEAYEIYKEAIDTECDFKVQVDQKSVIKIIG